METVAKHEEKGCTIYRRVDKHFSDEMLGLLMEVQKGCPQCLRIFRQPQYVTVQT